MENNFANANSCGQLCDVNPNQSELIGNLEDCTDANCGDACDNW
jgi:hypothetical protein